MSRVFDRIVLVMFENQYRSYVRRDPFLRKLARAGADLESFFGAFHPSQTNYLASLAGEVCGVTNDDPPAAPLPQRTLVDLLEAASVSWKAYMEAWPGEAWNAAWESPDYPASEQPVNEAPSGGGRLARYFRKHNAFASFHSVQASEERWGRIVGEGQFWDDVAAGTLPEYSWFTPDIWNDGHYLYNTHVDTRPRTRLVPQLSSWLEYVFFGDLAPDDVQGAGPTDAPRIGLALDVDLLLSGPAAAWERSRVPPGTLIVVTFDEADYDAAGYDTNYDGPNQVYTVLLGDMIAPATTVAAPLNHYSLVKTMERNFGLGDLGKNDRAAAPLRFLWGEELGWTEAADTGLAAAGSLALAWPASGPCLFLADAAGGLACSALSGGSWSDPEPTGLAAAGSFAAAALGDTLHLVAADADGRLLWTSRAPDAPWSDPEPLGPTTTGAVALAGYRDPAGGGDELMLCWRGEAGFIRSLGFADGAWADDPGEVGQLTDGAMALGRLGPSLYLIYKERNTRGLRMTSYNLAPWNAFSALAFDGSPAPGNDTALRRWAPADFPVGHFALHMAALQDDYLAAGDLALGAVEGELHLVHRRPWADTPQVRGCVFGLTGILTAADPATNGWGTLDQAGWSRERDLAGVETDPDGGLALAGDGERLVLVWQESGAERLRWRSASFRCAPPSRPHRS